MWFYNFFLTILAWLALPLSNIWVPPQQRANRRGDDLPAQKDVIWIHAASVGEINAIKPFIGQLQKRFPQQKIVLSTMTASGQAAAQTVSEAISSFYFPFDTYLIMRRTLRQLQPKMIIIAETELWPNLFYLAQKQNIPLEIVNARLSDKNFKLYRITSFLWKKIGASVQVNAKAAADAQRFRQLGFQSVINAHNLKFCLQLPEYSKLELRQHYGFSAADKILVWGSSRPGEEQLLKNILGQLQTEIPQLKVIIVPRHLNRISEVMQLFPTASLSSEVPKLDQINIIDQMGLLVKMYALADLAIIGGSFFDFGGHNPLEAVYYGVPTIIGNYHHACQDSVEILQAAEGIVVSDQEQLATDILKLLREDRGHQVGARGKAALQSNQASLEINLQKTAELLGSEQ
ncbi:MAG: glycosyltransferase N-terminal domain-containing protein [Candidatus Cloacimonadales bacterium]